LAARVLMSRGCRFLTTVKDTRIPLLREGGEYACLNYHQANDTWRTIETRARMSRLRSSACVKRNLGLRLPRLRVRQQPFSTVSLYIL
jgi:hypothetical protein